MSTTHNENLSRNLGYFMEWGGRNWETLLRSAIRDLQKEGALDGTDLLEVGTRYGKMATLFALMGAQVTGIDISEQYLKVARQEARNWNVPDVNFIAYNGNLDIFPDESFDIVFAKSVLVIVPDLEEFLKKVSAKLRPNGKIVFLENGRGNVLLHMLREVRHRKWKDYRDANYFTDKEIGLIQSVFEVGLVRQTRFPPIYLILGRKKLLRGQTQSSVGSS